MAQESPFETWGGMPSLVPQQGPQQQTAPEPPGLYGGLQPGAEGSYFTLTPEAMQMMWAPQAQPQAVQQPAPIPPPPQVQQLPVI